MPMGELQEGLHLCEGLPVNRAGQEKLALLCVTPEGGSACGPSRRWPNGSYQIIPAVFEPGPDGYLLNYTEADLDP